MISFSLQRHLNDIYSVSPRKLAFDARTIKDYLLWQASLRAELSRLLGLQNHAFAGLVAQKIHGVDRGKFIEEKLALDVGEGIQAPLYVLTPKQEPPYKPVLVFHGHDPSAQYCMGNYPDEETERSNLATDNNYAKALAEAGYLVCVVEQRGMGERLSDVVKDVFSHSSCRHLSFFYQLHGRTLLGERVWDGMCAATWLLSRKDVTGGLGCTGHSGGGTTALFLSALDERIAAVVVSGYFNSFRGSILAMEHCECNYVPGILKLAEMGDIAALIAPRPFCAINGQEDEIFPVAFAREQFETVRRAYELYNENHACELSIHSGGHAYDNQVSRAWFSEWLK
ncbi:MAG TPA: alpha/beta hydrolase family protein [Anaerolineales bacterium]|nr:alpha/beta hydrolase family protein [Anaerolineales bacterium]